MTPSPLPEIRDRIEQTVIGFVAEQHHILAPIAPELTMLTQTLEQFFAGGKLLRPLFVVAGGSAAAGGWDRVSSDHADGLLTLGGAIELVQAAALMHDDVIDNSPTRRGRPAVHEGAAAWHREQALVGEPADFGLATAVILGDLALSWAEQLAARALSGPEPRRQFDLVRTEVMAGQYLDILNQMGGFTSAPSMREASLTVTRWKTVPYTVLRPLLLGAAQFGADPELLEALSAVAVPLGTAFQLRDDLLGVFGDQGAIGKPASSDITEGKRTTLLAHALDHADAGQRAELQRIIGNANASPADVDSVRQIFTDTGARQRSETDVRQEADAARHALESRVRPLTGQEGAALLEELLNEATAL